MRRFSFELRRGITLIELLVVIGILVTLAAATIPVMLPAVEARRVREAARGVSTFITSARARAIERGRPVAVWIERLENEPAAAMLLHMAEVPPPHSGTIVGAMATEIRRTSNDGVTPAEFEATLGNCNFELLNFGDRVQFNHQGYLYEIVRSDDAPEAFFPTNPVTLQVTAGANAVFPWPGPTSGGSPTSASFTVYRQPQKTSADVYQLPGEMVIDLQFSGTDSQPFPQPYAAAPHLVTMQRVIIAFKPSGGIERIYDSFRDNPSDSSTQRNRAYAPSGTVFLLIGKREKIPAPTSGGTAEDTNWRDMTNLWVTISPQTGQSTTTEIAPGDNYNEARAFARDRGVLGGR